MLVLTRRENDAIVFPELGITVEVTRLTRSRASLGIYAPRRIKVIRRELLSSSDSATRSDGLVASTSEADPTQIRNEITDATTTLLRAQSQLESGNNDAALVALGKALAQLDTLQHKVAGGDSEESEHLSIDQRTPQTVSESATGYSVERSEDDRRARCCVLVLDPDDRLASVSMKELVDRGVEVRQTSDSLHALYELSRREKPDVVVLAQDATDPGDASTVRLLRDCSDQHNVRFIAADDVIPDECDERRTTLLVSSVVEHFRRSVDSVSAP